MARTIVTLQSIVQQVFQDYDAVIEHAQLHSGYDLTVRHDFDSSHCDRYKIPWADLRGISDDLVSIRESIDLWRGCNIVL